MRSRVAELEGIATERDRLAAEFTARTGLGATAVTAVASGAAGTTSDAEATGATTESSETAVDTSDTGNDEAAVAPVPVAEVDGREIMQDDLKVIEGIGPTVEELCHGIGIRAWSDLAHTEVSLLRTMLDDAGARFKMHDPTTWPRQAELLAEGRWDEFEQFTASLRRADDLAT